MTTSRRRWILPKRFVLFLGVFAVAAMAALLLGARWGQAVLAGFDAGTLAFAASLSHLLRAHTPLQMRTHARANDTNRLGVLLITSLIMLVIVTAVFVDLPFARAAQGAAKGWALGFTLASLVAAWLFSNLIYALHYAHMYYRGEAEGGLNFPTPREDEPATPHCPDFWDFIYFSATIGMAFATSDVEITRADIRRIAVLHGVAAFFYNLIVLAFTINVTAGS